MKRSFFYCLVAFATLASAQDITLDIGAEIDGTRVSLDSIFIKNLSNGDSYIFNDLSSEDVYTINLSQVTVGMDAEKTIPKNDQVLFRQNIPGKISFGFTNSEIKNAELRVFNLYGQQLYNQELSYIEQDNYFSLSVPGNHLNIVQITSSQGSVSSKVLGSTQLNSFGLLRSLNPNTNDIALKAASLNSDGSFSIAEGDLVEVRVFREGCGSVRRVQLPLTSSIVFEICCETLTDIDGNIYRTTLIGEQVWMAENLKVTHYSNGTAIPIVSSDTEWGALGNDISDDAFCFYENNTNSPYGATYSWGAAMGAGNIPAGHRGEQGICPDGWHLPTDTEWGQLQAFLSDGHSGNDATALKSTQLWNADGNGTDNYGFSALPGGIRYSGSGEFIGTGANGNWWSSNLFDDSSPYYFTMFADNTETDRTYINASYGMSVRCVKDAASACSKLVIATTTASNILQNSATLGGNVVSEGASPVSTRGIVYYHDNTNILSLGTMKNATSTGAGEYCVDVTSLVPATTYYFMAYASNDEETVYGSLQSFTTLGTSPVFGTVSDIDDNVYTTVAIGSQVWMAENLLTTRYRDGTSIPEVSDNSEWKSLDLTTGARCWWDNNETNSNYHNYGALYNWYAVDTENLCPSGWVVPTDDDWKTLEIYMGMNPTAADEEYYRGTNEGSQLKAQSTWLYDGNGTNDYGFSGLPAGVRHGWGILNFESQGTATHWWSSTPESSNQVYTRNLTYSQTAIGRVGVHKKSGMSVRCLRVEPAPTLPIVETLSATSISNHAAIGNGNVSFDGNATVNVCGIEFSTDAGFANGSGIKAYAPNAGTGEFWSSVLELESSTTYYYKAFATNAVGTSYGDEQSFETATSSAISGTGTVTDIDGNVYPTVSIGTQVWMAQNLEVTHYPDGDPIPHITNDTEWANLNNNASSDAYCFYNNIPGTSHGALYTWGAAMGKDESSGSGDIQGVCPAGWHLPSDLEWGELNAFLSDEGHGDNRATVLKHTHGWSSNGNGTNHYGFSALPGGERLGGFSGSFTQKGFHGYWWSSSLFNATSPYYFYMNFGDAQTTRTYFNSSYGMSVRCVKD